MENNFHNLLKKNDAEYVTSSLSEAESFLQELDETDRWVEDIKSENLYLSPQLFEQGMELFTGDETFTVSPHAMPSILKRAKNNSEILKEMNPYNKAKMLNMSWCCLENSKFKALIRGEKLVALHSERYAYLSQKESFAAFTKCFCLKFPFSELKMFKFNHDHSTMAIEVAGSNDMLMVDFRKAAISCGMSENTLESTKLGATMETGDLGNTSARIYPVLIKDGKLYPVGTDLSVSHRDGHAIEDIDKICEDAESTLNQAVKDISRLFEVNIKYPRSCATNVAKHFDIPIANIKDVIDSLDERSRMPVTAYDIWCEICEIMFTEKWDKLSCDRKLVLRGRLVKASKLADWSDFDKL